jgi:hypothetical protein
MDIYGIDCPCCDCARVGFNELSPLAVLNKHKAEVSGDPARIHLTYSRHVGHVSREISNLSVGRYTSS